MNRRLALLALLTLPLVACDYNPRVHQGELLDHVHALQPQIDRLEARIEVLEETP